MAVREEKVLPNRDVRPRMFGLGMVLKEIYLAYSIRFLITEQDLCLETWSQLQLMCTEKNFGSGYMVLRQRIYLPFCKIFDPYTLQKIKIEIFLGKKIAFKFHLIHTHFTIFFKHIYIYVYKFGPQCELNSCPDNSLGYSVWMEFSGQIQWPWV